MSLSLPSFEYPPLESLREDYAYAFKDPDMLDLLCTLKDPFEGSTCPEVEDRFLRVSNYAKGIIPPESTDVLYPPEISPSTLFMVGAAGRDFFGLDESVQSEFIVPTIDNRTIIRMPLLSLNTTSTVIDLAGDIQEDAIVLVKNPFSRIKGETFQMVQDPLGGYRSPLVIGTQNGLILVKGTLFAVDGEKDRVRDKYVWKVKRPVFDNGKYENMNIFTKVLQEKDLTILRS